jgi:hypothetical protein
MMCVDIGGVTVCRKALKHENKEKEYGENTGKY